ncbi:MAG: hypothetical protein J2P17_23515, partial [Mycobacterium sp.]|nr:hypothetical protein [Mycobacterium sp.]
MSDTTNSACLTDQVRCLLVDVLQRVAFPGREELVEQASNISVANGPITMLDLRTAATAPASGVPDGPIPISMVVSNPAGDAVGELLIWVAHGYLAALEFAWWIDDAPDELPDSDRVSVTR